MKNKEWYESLPKQGVLCRDDFGGLMNIVDIDDDMLIDDTGTAYEIFRVNRLTPQEWWDAAPWNYNVKEATKYKGEMLLKDKGQYIDIMSFNGIRFESEDGILDFDDVIAWLPLPENK